jgi:hypothetical protein
MSPNAGPGALLDGESQATWRTAAALLGEAQGAADKILFSTPFYGYEWPTVSEEPRAATRGEAAIITYAPGSATLLPDIRTKRSGACASTGCGATWRRVRPGMRFAIATAGGRDGSTTR